MVKLVGAKFPDEQAELLKQVCRDRGEDVSDFVRRSVKVELARLSYLSKAEKKALGVQ